MPLMTWDPPKGASNIRDHGLDFADARERFEWATALILPSYPGPDGRPRFVAVGRLDGQLVTLVFSLLGTEAVSAISLRTASNRERKRYAEG